MTLLQAGPAFAPEWANRAVVLAGASSPTRRTILERWLGQARQSGARTWLLSCAFDDGGVWSGLVDLLGDLVPEIQARAPELLDRHSYELCLVLPTLWGQLVVRNPSLTDTASEEEKVRNYPADRAYRSLHGIIDLLAEWHATAGDGPWVIACDDYDRANGLLHRFFAELLRRRGDQLGLTLILATAPEAADRSTQRFRPEQLALRLSLDDAAPAPQRTSVEWAADVVDIERRLATNPHLREMALPRLIHCLEQSGADQMKVLRRKVEAMHLYVHRGLYEAANTYADAVEGQLARFAREDPELLDLAINSLFFCYVPLGRPERALRVLQEEMIDRTDDPSYLPRLYYLVAMLHARFLPKQDQALAEDYLQRSLRILANAATLAPDRRAFLTVFTLNGLALVRVRQRRPAEAVELCRNGIALLAAHLRPDQHRLHRSVLEYNIAQVFAQIGPYDEAIAHFSAAMAMDPNYSEYYNERGSVFLKVGDVLAAEADYRQAIELSPPYPEVWTNLGQCYREQDRPSDAIAAYNRALDLDPTVSLALVGRADALAMLQRYDAAIADYTAALALSPNEPLLLASRAIAHYESGCTIAALADLNAAIGRAPDVADFYQNRAVALTDLGRPEEAVADLRHYLSLAPDADDRSLVEERIVELEAQLESGAFALSLTAIAG
jgi:tetratricopeptide (TPR) repeat protein